jgi:two-component system, chemotaxis family, sensor kinase CheA
VELDFEALIQTFKTEAEENLCRMEEALVALEGSCGDKELLHTIFRVAHTLKGNAAALGFTGLTEFAHRLEDTLDRLLKGTAQASTDLITALLTSVDTLRELLSASLAGDLEMHESHRELLDRLVKAASSQPETSGTPHPNQPIPQQAAAPAAAQLGSSVPASVESARDRRSSVGRRKDDAQAWNDRTRSLRVDIDKLDRMLNLTGEIAIARGRMRQLLDEAGQGGEGILEVHRDSDRLFLDLQELVMKIRMVPIGPTFRQHIRTVRDLATSSGKQARLEIEGEDVEVDTTVVNLIRDPLTHMLRNAVDHGLERPEQRVAAGKDPCGVIRLRASHETGNIVIELTDDGAGLNRKRIAEHARSHGLVLNPEKMTDGELFRLIFEPGFSTAEKVTDVSGRGVGMDVVRRNIEALRGTVTVESKEGSGTTFIVRLPLTLAIIEGFLVGVREDTYVLPLDVVVECVEMPEGERDPNNAQGVVNLRGKTLPYLRLRHWFQGLGTSELRDELGAAVEEPCLPSAARSCSSRLREHIVIVEHHEQRAGLVVDELYGENQTVIKPLGKVFQRLPGVSGSTILGNGRVALILDVPAIVREASHRSGDLSSACANSPVTA